MHMNASVNPNASGVEVIYENTVPGRERLAAAVSRAVARVLELPDRGAKSDAETDRKHVAIVEDTLPPALLIELGFVTNQCDVERVKERGFEALIAAIETIAKEHK